MTGEYASNDQLLNTDRNMNRYISLFKKSIEKIRSVLVSVEDQGVHLPLPSPNNFS